MREEFRLLKEAVKEKYDPLEYRACQIALVYENLRREFFNQPYTCLNRTSDKRRSRCFPHFYKLAKIERDHRDVIPDISLYLRAQFEITKLRAGALQNNVPIPPQHLHSKLAFQRYRDYIMQLVPPELLRRGPEKSVSSRSIIRSMGNTATLLTKFYLDLFEENDIDYWKLMIYTKEGDYQSVFFLFILQNLVSPYFLCASRHYPKWLQTLDPDCRCELPQNLHTYRETLLSNKALLDFGRSAFGIEFTL